MVGFPYSAEVVAFEACMSRLAINRPGKFEVMAAVANACRRECGPVHRNAGVATC